MPPPASQLETELARLHRTTRVITSALGHPVRDLVILELGASPLGALLAALGNTVVTVDPRPPPASLRGYLRVARTDGLAAALRQLVAQRLRAPALERALEARTGLSLDARRPTLVRRDLTRLPALDGRTDVVVMATLPSSLTGRAALASEVERVLAPGGVVVVDGQLVAPEGMRSPASSRDGWRLDEGPRLDARR